eukprot:SAG31_NODE_878_length_11297_cov_3.770714_6_plen_805_part_00
MSSKFRLQCLHVAQSWAGAVRALFVKIVRAVASPLSRMVSADSMHLHACALYYGEKVVQLVRATVERPLPLLGVLEHIHSNGSTLNGLIETIVQHEIENGRDLTSALIPEAGGPLIGPGRSVDTWTPLHEAARCGQVGMARRLLLCGGAANLQVKATEGSFMSPRDLALHYGHSDVVDAIDEYCRDASQCSISWKTDRAAICWHAAHALDASTLTHMLQLDLRLAGLQRTLDGASLLQCACAAATERQRVAIAAADSREAASAIGYQARGSSSVLEVVTVLLEAGADPAVSDRYGMSALHWAPDIQCARILLAHDNDGKLPSQRSHNGRLARQICPPAARALEELEVAHGLAEWVPWDPQPAKSLRDALSTHPTASALMAAPSQCVGLEVKIDGHLHGVIIDYAPDKKTGGSFIARLDSTNETVKLSPLMSFNVEKSKGAKKKSNYTTFSLFVHLEPGQTLSASIHGEQLWRSLQIYEEPNLQAARSAIQSRGTLLKKSVDAAISKTDTSKRTDGKWDVCQLADAKIGRDEVPMSWKDGNKTERKAWRAAKRQERALRQEQKELQAASKKVERQASKKARQEVLEQAQRQEVEHRAEEAMRLETVKAHQIELRRTLEAAVAEQTRVRNNLKNLEANDKGSHANGKNVQTPLQCESLNATVSPWDDHNKTPMSIDSSGSQAEQISTGHVVQHQQSSKDLESPSSARTPVSQVQGQSQLPTSATQVETPYRLDDAERVEQAHQEAATRLEIVEQRLAAHSEAMADSEHSEEMAERDAKHRVEFERLHLQQVRDAASDCFIALKWIN